MAIIREAWRARTVVGCIVVEWSVCSVCVKAEADVDLASDKGGGLYMVLFPPFLITLPFLFGLTPPITPPLETLKPGLTRVPCVIDARNGVWANGMAGISK